MLDILFPFWCHYFNYSTNYILTTLYQGTSGSKAMYLVTFFDLENLPQKQK